MKLLLLILLSATALEASKEQQPVYDLTIVDTATFADYDFWETPAGHGVLENFGRQGSPPGHGGIPTQSGE